MDKLSIPQSDLLQWTGRDKDRLTLSVHWLRFFQAIVDQIRVNSQHEIAAGREEVDGNWRIIQDGNNLVFQRRESGTWTTKDTITP